MRTPYSPGQFVLDDAARARFPDQASIDAFVACSDIIILRMLRGWYGTR